MLIEQLGVLQIVSLDHCSAELSCWTLCSSV